MRAAPPRCNASSLQRLNVTVTNHQRTRAVDSSLLRYTLNSLLTDLKISSADLAIHLVSSPIMTRLNEAFLKHTGSTDVITFDYADGTNPTAESARFELHGEVFICVNEAVSQARRFRTTWQSELVRYCVHGILHLLGLDDRTPAARRTMKRAEDQWQRELSRRFPLTRLARRRTAR